MVRALMAGTMPSTTAWRARSLLVQWVICKPSAMGSRQASATSWALWRGGNPLRVSQAGVVQQEFLQAALLVAAADPPDRGPVTPQAVGYGVDRLPCGNGQDNAGRLDLKEG